PIGTSPTSWTLQRGPARRPGCRWLNVNPETPATLASTGPGPKAGMSVAADRAAAGVDPVASTGPGPKAGMSVLMVTDDGAPTSASTGPGPKAGMSGPEMLDYFEV